MNFCISLDVISPVPCAPRGIYFQQYGEAQQPIQNKAAEDKKWKTRRNKFSKNKNMCMSIPSSLEPEEVFETPSQEPPVEARPQKTSPGKVNKRMMRTSEAGRRRVGNIFTRMFCMSIPSSLEPEEVFETPSQEPPVEARPQETSPGKVNKQRMRTSEAGRKSFGEVFVRMFCMSIPSSLEPEEGFETPSQEPPVEATQQETSPGKASLSPTVSTEEVIYDSYTSSDNCSNDSEEEGDFGPFSADPSETHTEAGYTGLNGAGDTVFGDVSEQSWSPVEVIHILPSRNVDNNDFDSEEDSPSPEVLDTFKPNTLSSDISERLSRGDLPLRTRSSEAERDKKPVLQMLSRLIQLASEKSAQNCPPERLESLQSYYFDKVWTALEGQRFSVTPEKKHVKRIFRRLTKKLRCSDRDLIFLLSLCDPLTLDALIECFKEHLAGASKTPYACLGSCLWFKKNIISPESEASSTSQEAQDSVSGNYVNHAVRLLVWEMLDKTCRDSKTSLPDDRLRENYVRLFNKIWTELESKGLDIPSNKIPKKHRAILKDLYSKICKEDLATVINLDKPWADRMVVSCVMTHLTKLQKKPNLFRRCLSSCGRALVRLFKRSNSDPRQ